MGVEIFSANPTCALREVSYFFESERPVKPILLPKLKSRHLFKKNHIIEIKKYEFELKIIHNSKVNSMQFCYIKSSLSASDSQS